MADNFLVNGTTQAGGVSVGGDDIAGIFYERVKLIHGTDGVNAGDVSTSNGLPVKQQGATSATLSNVSQNAASVTLLASNASRLGAIFVNDSTVVLYMKFGATASTTSFTYKLDPYDTVLIQANMLYTGIVDGIWASAGSGSARVTEI